MQQIVSSISNLLNNAGFGPWSIAISALLGFLRTIASSCCTLPLVGALAGYSVARAEDRRKVLQTSLYFMFGVIIALLVIGVLIVFAGQSIQKVSGSYWKIFTGIAALLFGIGALELYPFKLPKITLFPIQRNINTFGSGVSGIIFGGAIAISSLPCNPGIFIILGASVLQQHILWALFNLIAYAFGFSAPLTMLVYGFSLGKSSVKLQKTEKFIRTIAGIILIITGIYFFYSF